MSDFEDNDDASTKPIVETDLKNGLTNQEYQARLSKC